MSSRDPRETEARCEETTIGQARLPHHHHPVISTSPALGTWNAVSQSREWQSPYSSARTMHENVHVCPSAQGSCESFARCRTWGVPADGTVRTVGVWRVENRYRTQSNLCGWPMPPSNKVVSLASTGCRARNPSDRQSLHKAVGYYKLLTPLQGRSAVSKWLHTSVRIQGFGDCQEPTTHKGLRAARSLPRLR
ncbi:hypothetical protein OBBRIDRAFT_162788 [Obba rivulosa]|uniref:Uncharacterized protein n=1 Tax=Obba rivulosa TaxID=1052685 RepID=A0A8E2DR54_9APHY|nr:hypothetical protein OBBRIDRAFT_162788 [Obba rivulosa]